MNHAIRASFALFCILLALTSQATPGSVIEYYNKCSAAKYYLYQSDYDSAIKYFSEALEMSDVPQKNFDKYLLAVCYGRAGNKQESFKWLERSLDRTACLFGLCSTKRYGANEYTINDTSFNCIVADPELNARMIPVVTKYFIWVTTDPTLKSLRDTCQYFYANDCYYLSPKNRDYVVNSKAYSRHIDTNLQTHDRYKEKLVAYILTTRHIPNMFDCDEMIFQPAIANLDLDQKLKIKPILDSQFVAGQLQPAMYGTFLERLYLMGPGEKCKGYYITEKRCGPEFWNTYKENRASIGLSNYLELDDYSVGILWEKRKTLPWIY